MRLPKMKPRAANTLTVPDLAGGLNLRDGMSEILDNQLTDSKNVWFKDGVLKTRPGIEGQIIAEINNAAINSEVSPNELKTHVASEIKKHDIYYDSFQLCTVPIISLIAPDYEKIISIYFVWMGDGEYKLWSTLNLNTSAYSYFVAKKEHKLYCFTSAQEVYVNLGGAGWDLLQEEDMYIPLVAAHCKTDGSIYGHSSSHGGTLIEGYNFLTCYYRMTYSSYNAEAAVINSETNKGWHFMCYHLLQDVTGDRYKGKKVIVKHSFKGTVYEHVVTIGSSGEYDTSTFWFEENPPGDTLRMEVYSNFGATTISFYAEEGYAQRAEITEDDYEEDNIEIIAPYIPDNFEEEKSKIFNMTQAVWFGGTSFGLAGGTRLFLCGNRATQQQALVCWSGLNNPLYFPENSYFYVGNKDEKVTGFGAQSDKLIIFTENETWFTQYYQNTDITAEDLINQTVVDYAASSVYFPLAQINPNIGCPYPDTIQLCRNRLVWLGADKRVYTLVSESQYNERSIFSVSEMVDSKLKEETFEQAVACDWNGYYCLAFKNKIYLMDYNNYGYTHIASYSKTEDANIRIPWYYWEFPDYYTEKSVLMSRGESLINVVYFENGRLFNDNIKGFFMSYDNEITGEEIDSSVTTKLFSFSLPDYRKNIDRIDLQLGNNGGEPIEVEIVTDKGNELHMLEWFNGSTDNRNADYICSKAIFPSIRQISRMSLKISSNGPLIIDGMNIKYRITGGVR